MHHDTLFEALEGRTLLAGDVTAFVAGGRLFLAGDGDSNSIIVTQVDGTNDFTITSGADATTINGEEGPVTVNNVTRDIRARMFGGNDTLEISTVVLDGSAIIDMGEGDDTVTLTNVVLDRNMQIRTGDGNDTITTTGIDVARTTTIINGNGDNTTNLGGVVGRLRITGGTGAETIAFSQLDGRSTVLIVNGSGGSTITSTDSQFDRSFAVRSRDGTDTVTFTNSVVQGAVSTNQGAGDSSFTSTGTALGVGDGNGLRTANVVLIGGQGVDTVAFDDSRIGRDLSTNFRNGGSTTTFTNASTIDRDFRFRSGDGVDTVTVNDLNVARNTSLNTGDADDVINVDDSDFNGRMLVRTGDGADNVQIERAGAEDGPGSTFAQPVNFNTGSDDDTVGLGVAGQTGNAGTFNSTVTLNGGTGTNTLTMEDDANTFNTAPVVINFT